MAKVRAIILRTCQDCPFRSHGGGFGRISYVPKCAKHDPLKSLPYTEKASYGSVVASPTYVIPAWCPLMVIEGEEDEKAIITL